MIIATNSGKHKLKEGEELESAVQGILDMWPEAILDIGEAFCKFNVSDFHHEGVDGSNEIGKISARVFVAHRKADLVGPIAGIEKMISSLDRANIKYQFDQFPDVGHGVLVDEVDKFYELFKKFIES